MANAVIYVPSACHMIQFSANCLNHCLAHGYTVTGVVTGSWSSAVAMVLAKEASVIVIARPEHEDPEQEIRVESVVPDDDGRTRPMPAARRRPRSV